MVVDVDTDLQQFQKRLARVFLLLTFGQLVLVSSLLDLAREHPESASIEFLERRQLLGDLAPVSDQEDTDHVHHSTQLLDVMQVLGVEDVLTCLQNLLELFGEIKEEHQALSVSVILKELLANLGVSYDKCQAIEHLDDDLLVVLVDLLTLREELQELKQVVLGVELLHAEQVESIVSE